jgi:diguanylate cyclase (GGDEF)-like protein/PAS domain S-box-containing protein
VVAHFRLTIDDVEHMARLAVIGWLARQRLAVGFMVLGFLPLAVLSETAITLSRQAVTHEVNSRMASSAATFAAFATRSMLDSSVALQTFANNADLAQSIIQRSPDDITQMESQAAQVLWARQDFLAVMVLNSTGRVIAADPSFKWEGQNLGGDVWVKRSMTSTDATISDSFVSTYDQSRVVAISAPIRSPKADGSWSTDGLVVGIYDLRTLQSVIDADAERDYLSMYLIDQNDQLVAGAGEAVAGLVPAPPSVRSAMGKSDATVKISGGSALSAYLAVPELGWSIVSEVPTAKALAGLTKVRILVIYMAAILIAASLLGMWFMGRIDKRRRLLLAKADRQAATLAATEASFEIAFMHAPAGTARINDDGVIEQANLAFHEMLGYPADALTGRSLRELTAPDDAGLLDHLDMAARAPVEQRSQVEVRYLSHDSSLVWTLMAVTRVPDIHSRWFGLVQVVDISERKAAEARLNERAMHDSLTGLANRALLELMIDEALARARGQENNSSVVLMFIDLDGFKEINDHLGHHAGDEVLIEAATRLVREIRPGDTAARLGGDEFVVLSESIPDDRGEVASQLGARVLAALTHTGNFEGRSWRLGASIGISRSRDSRCTAATLLAEADSAMYRAKQQGKGRVVVFDQALDDRTGEDALSDANLATAAEQNRLRSQYQPVHDLRSGDIIGAECVLGMVGPDGVELKLADFAEAARARGHLPAFGGWLLMQACCQAAAWRAELGTDRDFFVAVRACAAELDDPGFDDQVLDQLARSGLPSGALVIAVDGSAITHNMPSGGGTDLQRLRAHGVRIAVDESGLGLSALAHLRRFPVDIIKVDTAPDDSSGGVTDPIVAIANILQLTVVTGCSPNGPRGEISSPGRLMQATDLSELLRTRRGASMA